MTLCKLGSKAHSSTPAQLSEALVSLEEYDGSGTAAGDVAKTINELGDNAELVVVGEIASIGLDGYGVVVTLKTTTVIKADRDIGPKVQIRIRARLNADNDGNEVVLVTVGGDTLSPVSGTVVYVADWSFTRYVSQPTYGMFVVDDGLVVPPPGCMFADSVAGLTLEQFVQKIS